MAYIRGHFYIYSGGDYVFFSHGHHADSGEGPDGKIKNNTLCNYGSAEEEATILYLPTYIVEEFVVMYHARMEEEVKAAAEKRVMEKYGGGNFGADGVMKAHGKKTVMEEVKEEIEKKDSNEAI